MGGRSAPRRGLRSRGHAGQDNLLQGLEHWRLIHQWARSIERASAVGNIRRCGLPTNQGGRQGGFATGLAPPPREGRRATRGRRRAPCQTSTCSGAGTSKAGSGPTGALDRCPIGTKSRRARHRISRSRACLYWPGGPTAPVSPCHRVICGGACPHTGRATPRRAHARYASVTGCQEASWQVVLPAGEAWQ